MSGDGKRRPRAIGRPRLPAGPLKDLKDFVYELYLEAGTPSLDEIAGWVAADDELAGAPERDTIHRIVRDAAVPPRQVDAVAVVTVLARAARWDPRDAAARARDLWIAARLEPALGVPLDQVTDPFALEVHRPIEPDGGDAPDELPAYVRRAHDDRLAEVVERAAGGAGAMAVLVAGSSAGKTRACWEALKPLREQGGWRLWHPYDPTRPDAALEKLDRVGPRTVVWLNETQEYLAGDGEQVAAKLRSLLTDPDRAPVLVLGTLWPEHHNTLTRAPGTQVRLVLEGTVIEVPETFTGGDLAALRQAAETDARLARATEHAEDGQITQYLAGGPELLERLRTAPPAAKALLRAAMDARRMGHRNALPHALLEEAVPAYLTEAQCDRLGPDWLEQALAYTSRPCKGARGPLTRIRPDRPRPRPRARDASSGGREGEPLYRLADYLDQHGRLHRADLIPPIGFWTAAAAHAHPADMRALGNAAEGRGLYRDAAQLFKNAIAYGDPRAGAGLVRLLHAVLPADHRPAHWAATYTPLTDPLNVVSLLEQLREAGAAEHINALLARDPATHADLTDPFGVAKLLEQLRKAGGDDHVTTLLARDPATHTDPTNPHHAAFLLEQLREAGAAEHINALLARDPATHVNLTDPFGVGKLLEQLRKAGGDEQVTTLATRAAAHVNLTDTFGVALLLIGLRTTGAHEEITALLARDPATHTDPTNPHHAAFLLAVLRDVGAHEQATALATRATAHADLTDPSGVALLLDKLREAGAAEHINALLARDPATHADLTHPHYVTLLLAGLWKVGAHEQVTRLLARDPAAHVSLTSSRNVGTLLSKLRKAGAHEQANALATRAIRHADLTDPHYVATLLGKLRKVGADDHVTTLLARNPAAHVDLTRPGPIAYLLELLRAAGEHTQISTLLARAPAVHADLTDLTAPSDVVQLMGQLQKAGAHEQVTTLVERLPAAGMFSLFLDSVDHPERFRFGREPDGSPADPWGWDDLD